MANSSDWISSVAPGQQGHKASKVKQALKVRQVPKAQQDQQVPKALKAQQAQQVKIVQMGL